MTTDTTTETTTAAATAAVPQQEPYVPEALGAHRIATMLAELTGEPVHAADIATLVEQEHLVEVDSYKGWPMYSTATARELDVELIRSIVAKRVAWQEASLPRDEAGGVGSGGTGATSPAWAARAVSPSALMGGT
ncbi:hypothetical protein EDD96_6771 [Streptomyces sp. Ag109_G2-6]|uniref:hypothetical protein n=1 Tax=Streptomyces TaxID=1883 RepID=UPI0009A557A7|nr:MULTISPECIES: hypothetical protein [Streptomyces]RPF30182.1 hypothetical protein EDD96_6771 [Streptomyces sp. Ag109_G2-6]